MLLILGEILLWQSFFRVQTIQAEGPEAEELKAYVLSELSGTHYGIIPKSSIFFLPEKELRASILEHFPEVQAVTIAPSGLTILTVTTTHRATVFWWCGISSLTPEASCYQADTEGTIFAPIPPEDTVASTSMLKLYAPLQSSPLASSSPIGARMEDAKYVPHVLEFVKAMRALGADITHVDIRQDEADLFTKGGTRITYVMGREQQAAALAVTAFPSFNLNNGSLLYVDLRFDSKVFFKKKDTK